VEKSRPTEFTTKADTNLYLVTYKREKPDRPDGASSGFFRHKLGAAPSPTR